MCLRNHHSALANNILTIIYITLFATFVLLSWLGFFPMSFFPVVLWAVGSENFSTRGGAITPGHLSHTSTWATFCDSHRVGQLEEKSWSLVHNFVCLGIWATDPSSPNVNFKQHAIINKTRFYLRGSMALSTHLLSFGHLSIIVGTNGDIGHEYWPCMVSW